MFDIKRSEVKGPILQFQSVVFEKEDIKKLIYTLNKACEENGISDARLEKAFDVWYPTLEEGLNALKNGVEDDLTNNLREEHSSELIEEILELSRDNQRLLRNPDRSVPESVASMQKQLECLQRAVERPVFLEKRRKSSRRRDLYLEEFFHSISMECGMECAFLVLLSELQDVFPWLYTIGNELLKTISAKNSFIVKQKALDNFKKIMVYSFEHPMMREICRDEERDYALITRTEEFLREILHNMEMKFLN